MTCPRCGWNNVRPSARIGFVDYVMAVVFLAPFRCRNCRSRFFRFSKRIGNDFSLVRPEAVQDMPVPEEVVPEEVAPEEAAPVEPAATPIEAILEATVPIEQVQSIAIVDSDVSIRKLLRRVLERDGYRIFDLSDAKDLASELREHPVDLLITDTLHFAHTGLKIIVLSGSMADDEFPGVFAVLPKPVPSEALLESVREALASHRV